MAKIFLRFIFLFFFLHKNVHLHRDLESKKSWKKIFFFKKKIFENCEDDFDHCDCRAAGVVIQMVFVFTYLSNKTVCLVLVLIMMYDVFMCFFLKGEEETRNADNLLF